MSFIFKQVTSLITNRSLDLVNDEISVILINDHFEPKEDDQTLKDIPSANISTSPVTLENKSFDNFVFDANPVTFKVVCGSKITGIIIFKNKSKELIGFIDKALSFPITPNGGDIIVTWSNGPCKIFEMQDELGNSGIELSSTKQCLNGEKND